MSKKSERIAAHAKRIADDAANVVPTVETVPPVEMTQPPVETATPTVANDVHGMAIVATVIAIVTRGVTLAVEAVCGEMTHNRDYMLRDEAISSLNEYVRQNGGKRDILTVGDNKFKFRGLSADGRAILRCRSNNGSNCPTTWKDCDVLLPVELIDPDKRAMQKARKTYLATLARQDAAVAISTTPPTE